MQKLVDVYECFGVGYTSLSKINVDNIHYKQWDMNDERIVMTNLTS